MKSKLLGVLLALTFGFLGTIPWIMLKYFGWVASLAGFIIGIAAFKGYELGNGSIDRLGKITAAIVILVSVPLAEIILIGIYGLEYTHDFIQLIQFAPMVFFENLGEFASSIFMGYLMAGLGTYSMFLKPKVKTTAKQEG